MLKKFSYLYIRPYLLGLFLLFIFVKPLYSMELIAIDKPFTTGDNVTFVYREEVSSASLEKQRKLLPSWPILDKETIKKEVLKALEEKPLIN